MKRSGYIPIVYACLVFLSGAVVGVFGHQLYTARAVSARAGGPPGPRPADYRKKYVDEMTNRLQLNPQQVTQLGSILDETRSRYHEEHERSKQQLAEIHNDQVLKIKEILTPAQVPGYDKFRAEREKERQAREKGNRDRQPPKP